MWNALLPTFPLNFFIKKILTSKLEQQLYSHPVLGTVLLEQEPASSYCNDEQNGCRFPGLHSVLGFVLGITDTGGNK